MGAEGYILAWGLKEGDLEGEQAEASRWDNLIHVDMQFYLNGKVISNLSDFLFKEEFLWERSMKSVDLIKQFSVEMIHEKIVKDGNLEKVGNFSIDFLECKI